MDIAIVENEEPQVDRAARAAEVVGAVAGTVGPPMVAAGGLWLIVADWKYDEVGALGAGAVLALGGAGTVCGTPLLLGAALHERRQLVARGVPVSGTAGAVGWGLFGAAMAAEVALWTPIFLDEREWIAEAGWFFVPVAPYAGAIAAGIVQRDTNARAARAAGVAATERSGPSWLIAPALGRTAGLALHVAF